MNYFSVSMPLERNTKFSSVKHACELVKLICEGFYCTCLIFLQIRNTWKSCLLF